MFRSFVSMLQDLPSRIAKECGPRAATEPSQVLTLSSANSNILSCRDRSDLIKVNAQG